MSKQRKQPNISEQSEQDVALVSDNQDAQTEQAVESAEDFAKKVEEPTASTSDKAENTNEPSKPMPAKEKKSGGKGIAVLALLIALGIGGAGHFFANKKFAEVEAQLQAVEQKAMQNQPLQTAVELPSFEAEKAQIAKLVGDYQQSLVRVEQLEKAQTAYTQQIQQLQAQIQKLGSNPTVEPSVWLLSDADFLLNNALRKMVLDNDIDTAKSLLIEADNVLSQVNQNGVLAVREAIKNDLTQLASVNNVDQNNLMQRLSQLANLVDDMPLVDVEDSKAESGEVSGSLEDWQQNLEKSANSFLSHFIRVSDKGAVNDKVFVAPNQEIYLRENIRLRLQIAILTVPRQQNELYKQSLEAVSTWVRSYFEVKNSNVKTFLKEIDDLIEQSIYVDAPTRLQSLTLLDQLLNKTPKAVEKIQLDENKSLAELAVEPTAAGQTEKAAEPAAEKPAEQPAQTEQQ
ncbi:HemX protein [Muribacter muris]|uniref:HemX protein n=1 Tax=Muribacter muris TaxID=67855 RepID=A0A4Y9K4M7_9PAST|nr:uroporphyrinogen-III C-methyltransferase [Muribacter muris]MBF0784578.1 uroporphyrinogen-III C-methyltransferase [Muribacter muris]MBF0826126.1 uroporphyrinogen-III C-methyltransferase [Muribacter muris]TFV12089.1 HemX protein [Muribacter muris]